MNLQISQEAFNQIVGRAQEQIGEPGAVTSLWVNVFVPCFVNGVSCYTRITVVPERDEDKQQGV